MKPQPYPGLEIPEDLRYERREWLVQRIVWPMLYALLIAIAFGLFGDGPISDAATGARNNALHIEYQRFMRYRSPDLLRVTVRPAASRIALRIDKQYVRDIDIRNVTPRPDHVVAGSEAMTFVFHAISSAPVEIVFDIRPQRIGTIAGAMALNGQAPVPFSQFVYP
jgi:hypothetical protein